MTYKYELCITIPTYNREKYLKRLLDSIVSQKSFSNEISVVINDGPSKDDTEKIVKEFQKQYKNIFYYRNEKAVGMLPAILESMDMSNGKYTRLFGSDDFLAPNAIGNILKCINENNPKIIYSRRNEVEYGKEIVDNEEKLEILPFKGMLEFSKFLGDKMKGTFHDKDVLFTFMSVFCVNSDYYKKSYDNLVNNIGYSENELKKNYFNFNLVALSNIKDKDVILFVNSPILVFCETNFGWNPNKKIFKDLKYLTNKTLNKGKCFKFLFKLHLNWYFHCAFVPHVTIILKKIHLYNIIRIIYKKILKCLNGKFNKDE